MKKKILFEELNLHVVENEQYPKDFYNFLIYKLTKLLENNIKELSKHEELSDTDNCKLESYNRLLALAWQRNQVKKAIMTITYNASDISMVDYIKSNLYEVPKKSSYNVTWLASTENSKKHLVNMKDLFTLVSLIKQIVISDFEKIKKLTKYLKNVATILNIL